MVTNPRETRMPLRSIDKPSSVRSWSVNPESGSLRSAAPRSLAINAAAARLSSSDLPGADVLDRLRELHAFDVFDDIPRDQNRIEHRLIRGVRRQHLAEAVRQIGQQIAAQLDPVAVGQANIEHGDVGSEGGNLDHRLADRSGFADDLEFGVPGAHSDAN